MALVSCRTGIPDVRPARRVNGFLGSSAMSASLRHPGRAFGRPGCCPFTAPVVRLRRGVSRPPREVVGTEFVLSGEGPGVTRTASAFRPRSRVEYPYRPLYGPTPTTVGKRTPPAARTPPHTDHGRKTHTTRPPDTTPHRPWSENAHQRRRPGPRSEGRRAEPGSAALPLAERLRHAGDDQGPVLSAFPGVQGRLAVDLRALAHQRHGDRLAAAHGDVMITDRQRTDSPASTSKVIDSCSTVTLTRVPFNVMRKVSWSQSSGSRGSKVTVPL